MEGKKNLGVKGRNLGVEAEKVKGGGKNKLVGMEGGKSGGGGGET